MTRGHRWMASLSVFGLGLAALMSSGAVAAAGAGEFTRPPYAGAYEPQGVDERGLWMQLDEYERRFRDSPAILRDETLTAYVHGILCRTDAGRCAPISSGTRASTQAWRLTA
jgi:hypothetical protein